MYKPVIKSKTLELLKEEADEDMILRIDRTDADALDTPKIYNKYHKEYRIVKNELLAQQLNMKKMWLHKWLYYSGKSDPKVYKEKPLQLKIMASNVKMFIEGDEDIIKLAYIIGMMENKLEFLEGTLLEIGKRSFHIKNAIDSLKFKHGVN